MTTSARRPLPAALMAAIERVVGEPDLHTADIGGRATTVEVTKATIAFIGGRNSAPEGVP